MLLQYFCT